MENTLKPIMLENMAVKKLISFLDKMPTEMLVGTPAVQINQYTLPELILVLILILIPRKWMV